MEGKGHEPSVDANDRESRIQARRNRIETRNASKDDETRKKKQLVGESKRMSRGQQQIADSLNQLDRRKLAGIQNVTSVRVHADDTENKRRIDEEERRHKRVEKLQQEAIASGAKNAAVEMRWSDLFEFSMPQELHRELEAQNRSCAEILASKDGLIREFQNQLKAKDEEYVTALKVQADEVEKLIDHMSQQYREMQDEYEMELEQMEDAFLKERDELIANNKLEIDSLFEKRREMEMVYMEAKQARDEQYLKEIENLRVKDAEDYNELKIKLETNIQTLEQQLEEMRATYQLNTEKLEYNYRVLTERDMENSATLSQQKRKLTRLKDALSTLISKYNQTDARDRNQNQELTEEYRRLTKQYKDLQKKYTHFETSDRNKYDEVWMMHEKEAVEKIEKLLNADKIIHEQQLGLVWKRPAQSIRDWSQIGAMKKKKQEQLSAGARTSDERGDGDVDNHYDGRNGDAFGEIDLPVVRKISSSKLKYMLKLLATEAGFLVNGNFQQALENLPDDEAELVKADMIMRALGVDNEDDMERLMGFFFQDPRAEVPMEYGSSSGSSSNLNGTPQQVPTPKWGLMIGPEDVIRVIKQFVEEMNEQKRVAPLTRMLRRASNSHGDDGKHKVTGGSKGSNASSSGSSSAGTNAVTLKARAQRAEREYWDAVVSVIPPRTRRVMDALDKGLTMYHHALLRRKGLIDGVTALKQQNAELKTLLKQYLGAAINEDLLVPPTQMQLIILGYPANLPLYEHTPIRSLLRLMLRGTHSIGTREKALPPPHAKSSCRAVHSKKTMAPNMKMMGVTMGLALFCNTFLNNDNYTHVLIVRGLYALSQVFVYSTLLLIYTRAKKNTEPGVVTVKEDIGFGQEGEKDEKITVSEYDMRQTMSEVQKIAIGTAITIFIHSKWGFFPPLFIQTVTQPYNLFQSPLAKVTLLGQKAWGELRRPWQNPMAMGTQWNKWNDTIQSALGGEPVVRQSKKAAKKAAGKRKSK